MLFSDPKLFEEDLLSIKNFSIQVALENLNSHGKYEEATNNFIQFAYSFSKIYNKLIQENKNISDAVGELFSILLILSKYNVQNLFHFIELFFDFKLVSDFAFISYSEFIALVANNITNFSIFDEKFPANIKDFILQTTNKLKISIIENAAEQSIFSFIFSKEQKLQILSNYFFLTNPNTKDIEILLPFYSHFETGEHFIIKFLSDTIKSGNLALLQPFMLDPKFLVSINSDVWMSLLNSISPHLFCQRIHKFMNALEKLKNTKISEAFLLKIADFCSEDYFPRKINLSIAMKYCNLLDKKLFGLAFWDKIGTYFENIKIPHNIIEKIREYIPIETLVKLTYPLTFLAPEETIKIIQQSTDIVTINCLLLETTRDFLDLNFWIKYLQLYKLAKCTQNAKDCFFLCLLNHKIRLIDILFNKAINYNDHIYLFILSSINSSHGDYSIYNENNINKYLLENINNYYSSTFWKILDDIRFITVFQNIQPSSPNYRVFYFGLSMMNRKLLQNAFFENRNYIHFFPLDEQSYNDIINTIQNLLQNGFQPIKLEELIDNIHPSTLSPNAILFISTTILFLKNISNQRMIRLNFTNNQDFFLFFILFIIFYINYQRQCTFPTHRLKFDFRNHINTPYNEKYINILIDIIITFFNHIPMTIFLCKTLITIATKIVSNYPTNQIKELFPRFEEFILYLFIYYAKKHIISVSDTSFPCKSFFKKFGDNSILIFFQSYINNKKIFDSLINSSDVFPDRSITDQSLVSQINKLLNEPTILLVDFLLNFCDFSHILKNCTFDKKKIVELLKNCLSPNESIIKSIDELINLLNEDQIRKIILKWCDCLFLEKLVRTKIPELLELPDENLYEIRNSIIFSSFYHEKLKNEVIRDTKNLLNNKNSLYYDKFKKKLKTMLFLSEDDDDTILLKFTQNINNIDINDLISLDNFLNPGYNKYDETFELILFLLKTSINQFCYENKNNLSLELQRLFLVRESLKDIFDIITNQKLLVKHILLHILAFQRLDDLQQLLNLENDCLICNKIQSIRCSYDMKLQSVEEKYNIENLTSFAFNYCKDTLLQSSYEDLFTLLMVLDDSNIINGNIIKILQQKICFGSSGILFYVNLFLNSNNSLRIDVNQFKQITGRLDEINKLCFTDACGCLFEHDDTCLFFKDVKKSQFLPPQRQVLFFYSNLFDFIPFNYSTLPYFISCVANFPFLFTFNSNFDVISLVKKITEVLSKLTSIDEILGQDTIIFRCIILLYELLKVEELTDSILSYFFKNYMSLSVGVIYAFNFVLFHLLNIRTFQTILSGCFKKYDIIKLILQYFTSHSGEISFKSDFINYSMTLIHIYLKCISNERVGLLDTIDIISNMDQPFLDLVDRPILDQHLSIYRLLNSQKQFFFLKLINKVEIKFSKFNLIDLHKFPKIYKSIVKACYKLEDIPFEVDIEYFNELPDSKAFDIIQQNIPRIKGPINYQIQQELMKYPSWIGRWIYDRPTTPILPRHSRILTQCIERLNEILLEQRRLKCCHTIPYINYIFDANSLCNFIFSEDVILNISCQSLNDIVQNLFYYHHQNDLVIKCLQHAIESFCLNIKAFLNLIDIGTIAKDEIIECVIKKAISPSFRNTSNLLKKIFIIYKNKVFQVKDPHLSEEFLFICMTSDDPEILLSAAEYAESSFLLAHSKYIESAFLRCINHDNMHDYYKFMDKIYKTPGFENCQSIVVCKLRDILESFSIDDLLINIKKDQIISLFSIIPNQVTVPKDLTQENYPNLNSLWQTVFDYKDILSEIAIENQEFLLENSFMRCALKFLSFKSKRKYFQAQTSHMINSHSSKTISIRRNKILEDSYHAIMDNAINPRTKIRIKYDGEVGVDAGGLLRDWFTNLVNQLFNENYALFVSSKLNGRFLPNSNSKINEKHLSYFEFTGLIFARAIIAKVNLEPHLASPLLKKLLGLSLTLDDMQEVDHNLFSSLKWILDKKLSDFPSFEQYFTVDVDEYGRHETTDLIEGGSNIRITDENKDQYIKLMVEYRIGTSIQEQSDAFCKGFFSLIGQDKISYFSPNELDQIISGDSFIDVLDFKNNCKFSGIYSHNHPTIVMFFNVIQKWSQNDLSKLLMFITGSTQVPLGGFASYEEAGSPITINSVSNKNLLICGHTCVNQIDLPEYETEEEMNKKLQMAIQECNTFDIV